MGNIDEIKEMLNLRCSTTCNTNGNIEIEKVWCPEAFEEQDEIPYGTKH